jgi:hypothetical protein
MNALLIALAGLIGLTVAAKPPDPMKPQPLPIDSLGVPKEATLHDPAIARVSGHYPTPLWRFDHWQTEMDGSTIKLTPYGINQQRPDQMVAQVLMPFTLPKALTALRPGHYTLVVNGRNKKLSAPLTVKDSEIERGFPYLDSVTGPERVAIGEHAKLTVTGNLPDSGWHAKTAEIKVGDGVIWVYPWAERKRSVFAAEMLKSAEWQVRLPVLPEGDYRIIVEGRDREQSHVLRVDPAKQG